MLSRRTLRWRLAPPFPRPFPPLPRPDIVQMNLVNINEEIGSMKCEEKNEFH